MQSTKMLRLVLPASMVALLLLLGVAGQASAATLCKANENPCAAGNRYEANTLFHATLKSGVHHTIVTSIGNLLCELGLLHGHSKGPNQPVVIDSESYSMCSFGATACTVTTEHLSYAGAISASGGGNGTLTMEKEGTNGKPQATVQCGALLKCTFGLEKSVLSISGGNPATLKASGVELEREGGAGFLCPSSAKWSAEFEFIEPKPLFVSAEP